MFDIQSLQANSEHPTLYAIGFSVLLAFVLSSLIVLTYDITTNSIKRNHHFLQSLALISILATMVMQAVGDSLARGLGMLGALAIIRFRTTLRDPRNMTFMFASLAVGISCGAFGFVIATVGTVSFCLLAFLICFGPFGKKTPLIGQLQITAIYQKGITEKIESVLKSKDVRYELKNYRTRSKDVPTKTELDDSGNEIVIESINETTRLLNYDIVLRGEDLELVEALNSMEGVKEVKIRFERTEIEI